jgi:glycosyltransferase involved in cell wall biosynthesis
VRVGVSSFWFNRGQAVVGRQLRSGLEELGHETTVLARPAKDTAAKPGALARDDVWDQPGVTAAANYLITSAELEGWARENELDAVLFDQNYQFEEISRLRALGVRTYGRFVWEQFSPEHAEGAKRAFDAVYSVTAAERERYAGFGIDSPRVRWGCHPELLASAPERAEPRAGDPVTFFFPGGYMTKRKPVAPVLEAFSRTRGSHLRLVVKAQIKRRMKLVKGAARKDHRIEWRFDDLPDAEHKRLFAAADVCLAPSRWEGLGLHLYEATAFEQPIVTNDNPPMNEVVRDGENGILVRGVELEERADSGIPAYDPDVAELTAAIERLGDPAELAALRAGARRARERLSWQNTLADLAALLGSASTETPSEPE